MLEPLKTVIVGGGHRSLIYAGLSDIKPDMMEIVGIVDPNEFRRNSIAEKYSIPKCFMEMILTRICCVLVQ